MAVVWIVAAGAVVSVAAADAVSSARDCSEVVNDPSRLGSLDPNNRLCWWEEALDVYACIRRKGPVRARSRSPASGFARTYETSFSRTAFLSNSWQVVESWHSGSSSP